MGSHRHCYVALLNLTGNHLIQALKLLHLKLWHELKDQLGA